MIHGHVAPGDNLVPLLYVGNGSDQNRHACACCPLDCLMVLLPPLSPAHR